MGQKLQRLRREKLPALRVSVRYAPDQAKNESLLHDSLVVVAKSLLQVQHQTWPERLARCLDKRTTHFVFADGLQYYGVTPRTA